MRRFAEPERVNYEAYPLTMAVFRIFRASARATVARFSTSLRLGSDTMLDLGNLYTAALPAWIAAGLEQALDEGHDSGWVRDSDAGLWQRRRRRSHSVYRLPTSWRRRLRRSVSARRWSLARSI